MSQNQDSAKKQQDLQVQYQNYKNSIQQIAQKIGDVEQEAEEHKLVLETLATVPEDRKCFRMINGVLVEKTVKEVMPALKTNSEGLKQVLDELLKQYKTVQTEMDKWKLSAASPYRLDEIKTLLSYQYGNVKAGVQVRPNVIRGLIGVEHSTYPAVTTIAPELSWLLDYVAEPKIEHVSILYTSDCGTLGTQAQPLRNLGSVRRIIPQSMVLPRYYKATSSNILTTAYFVEM